MRALVRSLLFAAAAVVSASPLFASCPAAPSLVSPANGAVVTFGLVEFKWTGDAFATSYDINIGLDGGGMSPVATVPGGTTTKKIPIEAGRSVEWKVVAKADSCSDMPSTSRMFTTSCPSTVPNLVTPANNTTVSTGTSIKFDWDAVPGAAGYDVKISPHSEENWTVIASDLGTTSFTTSTIAEGDYDWEVRANFNGACGPNYSVTRRLKVVTGCVNPTPTLVAPADQATNVANPVSFKWSSLSGATSYRVIAAIDGGTPSIIATTTATQATATLSGSKVKWVVQALFAGDCNTTSDTFEFELAGGNDGCPANPGRATLVAPAANATNLSSPVTFQWNPVSGAQEYRVIATIGASEPTILGTTTSTSLTADLPAGTGTWIVQTLFGNDCPSTLSERRTMTITTGASCNNAAPQLVAPANGAQGIASPVVFQWTAVPDAIKYRLFVATGDDDEFSFYGETTSTSMERVVPDGVVRWAVVAVFAACPEVRSSVSSFVAGAASACDPNASIALLAPANGAQTSSPAQLSWSAVAGAESYRVWASIDGSAPANVARTTSTTATVNLPAGAITWYVEARRSSCDPVVSPNGSFTILSSSNCATNAAPVLTSPVGTESAPASASSPVTLTWAAVDGAIGYRVWIAEDREGYEDVTLTKTTSVELELEPDEYAWYVEALFDGCTPRASATAYFDVPETEPRCTTAAPTPIAPAGGATSTSSVTFSWTAVPEAEKYRVFIEVDGAKPVLLATTDDTSITRSLPPGSIEWAVEAVFESCPSTLSQRAQFTIARSQNCPTAGTSLVSPQNGAQTSEASIDFVWNAVSGAVQYTLVAEVNEGSPTALATTSDTHATVEVPAGAIEWWVVTTFAGCDALRSEQYDLTITRAANCDTRKPLLILPQDDRGGIASPVHSQWAAVPRATNYRVWARPAGGSASIVASTPDAKAVVDLGSGVYEWFVEALFDGCPPIQSARGEFKVVPAAACGTPAKPAGQVVGQVLSGTSYNFRWTPLSNVQLYEVQEASSTDFANATTFTTDETSLEFAHEALTAPVPYFYRVRGVSSCSDARGAYSPAVRVFVTPRRTSNASTEIGSASSVVQTAFVPGRSTPVPFIATVDKPWLAVTPSSGTLPVDGITLTVTANSAVLPLGTNTATIKVEIGAAGKDGQANAGTTTSIPMSVSLVTPVMPSGKGTPPPDSLIFGVVGHAQGVNNSLFESDIRVTNLSAQTMKYQLNFTPSAVNGTITGSSSSVEIAPNATMALDDIIASMFGSGTASTTGMLEVRPLTTSSTTSTALLTPANASTIRQLTTAASSRTYNFTPTGTFGQFIPATRFADFVGRAAPGLPASILSLQQVAQSSAFRANFGFAEAAGQPADLMVRVYDTRNQLLASIPVSLQPMEHRQINNMLSTNGITSLTDGRVEVEVIGGDGKVTAYVSEVDNKTNDPLLVSPVVKGAVTADRYVVPGVAYLTNSSAFWVTDLRIFNAGPATPATLTFYPQGAPHLAVTREITLDEGEIEVLDNVIGDLFAQPNGAGGSVAITTPAATALTATARTYNNTGNGTYGQYVPGVTVAESVGVNDRALQLLQLEQSSRFRTNVGVAETSGQPVTVELSLVVPDSLVTPVVSMDLAANEFRQISLSGFGLGSAAYNARVTVKVVGGAGRVTAYGSAIDAITQDPTYVPAQ